MRLPRRVTAKMPRRGPPGIDGVETCSKIRARCHAHVVMLTVRDSNQDAVAARDAPGADIVRYGNVEIRVDHCVTVNAKDVRLTPKEFDLLRFLVSNGAPTTTSPSLSYGGPAGAHPGRAAAFFSPVEMSYCRTAGY
jgi:DNA-binding response OmpR family regulator